MKLPLILFTAISVVAMQAGKINDAANSCQWDEVRQLVEEGVDINEKGGWGNTALHQAAYWGEIDMVKFLLERGADKKIRGGKNRSALDNAKKGTVEYPYEKDKERFREVVKILEDGE